MNSEPVDVAIGLIESAGRLLVGTRSSPPLVGMAEFPGGKCLPGESLPECVIRECREETGLAVQVCRLRMVATHSYPHGVVRLWFYDLHTRFDAEREEPLEPFRWVAARELATLEFPQANASVVQEISGLLNQPEA